MVRISSVGKWWRAATPAVVVLATALLITACSGSEPAPAPIALSPLAEQGAALAKTKACVQCHTPDGKPAMGPTWKGLLGSPRTMIDGSTVIADEAYIRLSIVNPSAQRLATANTVMPQVSLTDDELNALVAYISAL